MLLGSLGEGNGEQTKDETIRGLGLHDGLNEGVPLFNHGASLVSGHVHSIEVGVAIESLDLIDLELELSPGLTLTVVVAVSERDGEDTTFQVFRSLSLTSSLVGRSQSNASFIESWHEDVVPLFLHEWMGTIIHRVSIS